MIEKIISHTPKRYSGLSIKEYLELRCAKKYTEKFIGIFENHLLIAVAYLTQDNLLNLEILVLNTRAKIIAKGE